MGRTYVWNGVELVIPAAYSYTDVSRLLTPVSGGVGIVALVGESDGGKPGVHLFAGGTSPKEIKKRLQSGPGADMVKLALRAGNDPLVQAGASTVLFVKTNPSTQSTAKVGGMTPAASESVAITCTAGTNLDGKYFILADEVGTVAFWFDLTGTTPEPSHGADRSVMIDTVLAGDLASAVATKVAAVIDGDSKFAASAQGAVVTAITVASGDVTGQVAGDSGFSLVITDGATADTTPVATLRTKKYGLFTTGYTASLSTSAGKVILSVYDENGLPERSPALGGTSYMTLLCANGTTATAKLSYASGYLKFQTYVDSVLDLDIDATEMTLTQLAQSVNRNAGYTMVVGAEYGAVKVSDLDLVLIAQSIKTTAYGFKASIYELAQWCESSSELVTLERSAGNEGDTLIGVNESGIVFAGGVRGTTTNSLVQDALNTLLEFRVNIIVPLFSSDNQNGSSIDIDSVNAMVKDHLISRSSILGRSEADGYVSVAGNKDTFKAMCAAMNTRRVSVTSQKVRESDIDGTLKEMPEYAFAVVCAQTQAGSPIGTPLTGRSIPSNGISQDVSWSPIVDGAELIKAGALIAGTDETNTIRIIAGYTSWTGDSNNANIFIETVESLDIFAFNHRKYMQEKFRGISKFTTQDVLNAIDQSAKAEIQQTASIKGWDPKQTVIHQSTGGVLRYDLAVIPWEGIVFILPTIIAIREA